MAVIFLLANISSGPYLDYSSTCHQISIEYHGSGSTMLDDINFSSFVTSKLHCYRLIGFYGVTLQRCIIFKLYPVLIICRRTIPGTIFPIRLLKNLRVFGCELSSVWT